MALGTKGGSLFPERRQFALPGSMPATSQLDWLISMTAMIVLFWSRATRDLLKSFSWGIAALHR
jgi:hypothetical protein